MPGFFALTNSLLSFSINIILKKVRLIAMKFSAKSVFCLFMIVFVIFAIEGGKKFSYASASSSEISADTPSENIFIRAFLSIFNLISFLIYCVWLLIYYLLQAVWFCVYWIFMGIWFLLSGIWFCIVWVLKNLYWLIEKSLEFGKAIWDWFEHWVLETFGYIIGFIILISLGKIFHRKD